MAEANNIQTVHLPDGVSLSGYRGEHIISQVADSNSYYEQNLLERWAPRSERQAVFYDIGANIGNHTLYFAAHAGARTVYAFEPMQLNFALLQKNIEDSQLSNVKPYNIAAGEANGVAYLLLRLHGESLTAARCEEGEGSFCAPMMALDLMELPDPDFVKIDVQGAEAEVLRGMRERLLHARPDIWLELEPRTAVESYNLLSELGYHIGEMAFARSYNTLFTMDPARDIAPGLLFQRLMEAHREQQAVISKAREDISGWMGEMRKLEELKRGFAEAEQALKEELAQRETALETLRGESQAEQQRLQAEMESRIREKDEEMNSRIREKEAEMDSRIREKNDEIREKADLIRRSRQEKDETIEKIEQEKKKVLRLIQEETDKQLRQVQAKYDKLKAQQDLYEKAKLFRLMLFTWKLSGKLRRGMKKLLYSFGSRIYRMVAPYPKIRRFCSRINGKLRIFKEPEKVISAPIKTAKGAIAAPDVELRPAGRLNVAMVVDEFTYNSFRFECNALPLEPDNWQQVFEQNKIDLFFCESAWAGTDSARHPWRGQIYCSINFPRENRTVLLSILEYCRQQHIPTVFWNKEDPTHYEDKVHNFVDTALRFDHIFTTSAECVERYRQDYGHTSVHLLPFATQPRLFNPIEKFERTEEIIFAGSWYRQHPRRCEEMGQILQQILASPYPLKIYDRHSQDDDPNHAFPEEYHPYIHPALHHSELDAAYKGSRYALNINTVTDSDTMFARRVFELMSSNTLVLSNYSKGMEELFGDNVVFLQGEGAIDLSDADAKRRACLYDVLRNHTYAVRFEQILRDIGFPHLQPRQTVCVLYRVNSVQQAQQVHRHFTQLVWAYKKMVLVIDEGCSEIDLREIEERFLSPDTEVVSADYRVKYEDPLQPEADYFIWATPELAADFLSLALLHFCYLPEETGVTAGNGAYKMENRPIGFNILYPMELFGRSKHAILDEIGQDTPVYLI